MRKPAWLLVVGLFVSAAANAVVIHRYLPAVAHPGGEVVLIGSGFGSWGDRRWKTVRIGQGANVMATLGAAQVPHWTPHAIGIILPRNLAPGTYWVGIYDSLGRLLSNRTPILRVERRRALSPP